MTVLSAALLAIFSLTAGMSGTAAFRAYHSDIPFGARLGLPGKNVRTSQRAWDEAHRKITPILAAICAISLIQTAGLAFAFVDPELFSPARTIWLAGVGAALIGGLLWQAVRTSRNGNR